MKGIRVLASVLALAVGACSADPGEGSTDGGDSSKDAGSDPKGPLPFPVARMDDGQLGFTHDTKFEGPVSAHSTAQQIPPSFGEVRPARALSVLSGSGSTDTLYYTLPVPFAFNALINDQVKVHYRERAEAFGSSYGARVEGRFGGVRVLFDQGLVGPAFDSAADRLDFVFERDPQALAEEPDDCGRKVRYPAVVRQGEQSNRMFPGESADFTLTAGGDVTFTLLDMYRLEDSTCGNAPEFSIGYIVMPKN